MRSDGKRLNLSVPEFEKKKASGEYRIAVVTSRWNHEITRSLRQAAVEELIRSGIREENILQHHVPGSFELPLAASWLAARTDVHAVLALGCVIKGETPHFDFISSAVAHGLTDVSLKYQKPVIFGVLTTLNLEQARQRAGGTHGNKGIEAAATCIEMLELQHQFL